MNSCPANTTCSVLFWTGSSCGRRLFSAKGRTRSNASAFSTQLYGGYPPAVEWKFRVWRLGGNLGLVAVVATLDRVRESVMGVACPALLPH